MTCVAELRVAGTVEEPHLCQARRTQRSTKNFIATLAKSIIQRLKEELAKRGGWSSPLRKSPGGELSSELVSLRRLWRPK